MLRNIPFSSFLDVGCGDGQFMALFEKKAKIAGMDYNKNVLKSAIGGEDKRFHDLNSSKSWPCKDGEFEMIFAGEVIEHVVDTEFFLKEAFRVLKPGGRLLLTTPNLASFENRIRLLLGMYPAWLYWSIQRSGHIRLYTLPTLRKHLKECGFSQVHITGNFVPYAFQIVMQKLKLPELMFLGKLFPSLSVNLIAIAQKPAANS